MLWFEMWDTITMYIMMDRSWQAKLQTTSLVVNLLRGGNSTEVHFRDLRNLVDWDPVTLTPCHTCTQALKGCLELPVV